MRLTAFASRNTKEILRDPLTFCFGLGFPVVLLLLLSAINSAIPEQAQMTMFNIDKLTPGITVFGMSFISLFSSMLIAKDRTTSFMMRLFTSPLKAHDLLSATHFRFCQWQFCRVPYALLLRSFSDLRSA